MPKTNLLRSPLAHLIVAEGIRHLKDKRKAMEMRHNIDNNYDRVVNKPRGYIPTKYKLPHQYNSSLFGRFIRAGIYITIAFSLGLKSGENECGKIWRRSVPDSVAQQNAIQSCETLKAYKLLNKPAPPWDITSCAVLRK